MAGKRKSKSKTKSVPSDPPPLEIDLSPFEEEKPESERQETHKWMQLAQPYHVMKKNLKCLLTIYGLWHAMDQLFPGNTDNRLSQALFHANTTALGLALLVYIVFVRDG